MVIFLRGLGRGIGTRCGSGLRKIVFTADLCFYLAAVPRNRAGHTVTRPQDAQTEHERLR